MRRSEVRTWMGRSGRSERKIWMRRGREGREEEKWSGRRRGIRRKGIVKWRRQIEGGEEGGREREGKSKG